MKKPTPTPIPFPSPRFSIRLTPSDEATLQALEASYESIPTRAVLFRLAIRALLESRKRNGLRTPKKYVTHM